MLAECCSMNRVNKEDIVPLLVFIGICQLSGVIGSFFTSRSIPVWYVYLRKPVFTPPGWLIGTVWIVLYTLMGVAAFLVWRRRRGWGGRASVAFTVQLLLNALWSIMFFGLRSPSAGLVNIVALWIAILLTIVEFYKLSRTAALLMVPYILWVSFAAFLNYSIFIMNS
jgi:tryptophan-rich sensory protein